MVGKSAHQKGQRRRKARRRSNDLCITCRFARSWETVGSESNICSTQTKRSFSKPPHSQKKDYYNWIEAFWQVAYTQHRNVCLSVFILSFFFNGANNNIIIKILWHYYSGKLRFSLSQCCLPSTIICLRIFLHCVYCKRLLVITFCASLCDWQQIWLPKQRHFERDRVDNRRIFTIISFETENQTQIYP